MTLRYHSEWAKDIHNFNADLYYAIEPLINAPLILILILIAIFILADIMAS